jgi:hypothetical protein
MFSFFLLSPFLLCQSLPSVTYNHIQCTVDGICSILVVCVILLLKVLFVISFSYVHSMISDSNDLLMLCVSFPLRFVFHVLSRSILSLHSHCLFSVCRSMVWLDFHTFFLFRGPAFKQFIPSSWALFIFSGTLKT